MATGVALGATNLVATFNGMTSNTANIEVIAADLQSIQITPATLSITAGLTHQYTATGYYSNGTSTDITSQVGWNTSNSSVATIGLTGLVNTTSVGNTNITASLNGVTSNISSVSVTNAVLVSIQATPALDTLPLGLTQQYTAIGTYSDNSTQDITPTVNWLSSETAVATINLSGLATTASIGSTTITANLTGITSNSATLNVSAAELVSIQVTPLNTSISLGTNQQYTATGTYTDGSTVDITASVTWMSSNTTTASIDNTGLATSNAVGNTQIRASLLGIDSSPSTLTVTNALLTSIVITPTLTSIPLGTSQQYTAQGVYSDLSTQNITALVSWVSSDTAIATIDLLGMADTVSLGTATITAFLDGITSNSVDLTVTAAELVSILVNPSDTVVPLGLDELFTAIGTYTDSTALDITNTVNWNSSNLLVATIDMSGNASTVALGDTVITASLSGITSNDANLTVTDPLLTSIAITPTAASVINGATQQYTATGTYSDASTQDITNNVTWASDQPTIASIDTSGLATAGFINGVATITATLDGVTSNEAALTVGAVLTSISLSQGTAGFDTSITTNSIRSLKLTGFYSDGSSKVINTRFNTDSVWSHTGTGFSDLGNGRYQATATTGTIDVTVSYGGFTDTLTNAITAIPVANRTCGAATLSLSDGSTLHCPPTTLDYPSATTNTMDGTTGPNGMVLPIMTYTEAENYCTGLGRTLPVFGVYRLVGWPTGPYWLRYDGANYRRRDLAGNMSITTQASRYLVACVD